ncbi:hypothetical protein [Nodosilinea sp. E11]|uniref:hypothetical protein n=1 Tax=Nodosilinea sp. E11 TaxID=3037479 RepID=UPI002934E4DB|nr:hypothetical protein [Nodosilinea sp. E11]WOD41722.1 hypothetical protein RRF56_13070 [Nodosilinea sp. E11]
MPLTIRLLRLSGCLAALGIGQHAIALDDWPHRDEAIALETSSSPPAASSTLCSQTSEFAVSCVIAAQETPLSAPAAPPETLAIDADALAPSLDLDPAVIEGSPTLQRWLEDIPDVADDIRHRPSFRSRLRVGYAQFPSTGQIGGVSAAVDDVFVVPGTGLTASADYSRSWNGDRESYGGEARYYLLPLGGYVNLAPTVGYRSLSTPAYQTNGLDVGLRLMLVPSRGGGADLALSQRWVAPGSEGEVGITSLAIGYAVTRQLRLGTDFQRQNSRFGQDSRVGVSLELLL